MHPEAQCRKIDTALCGRKEFNDREQPLQVIGNLRKLGLKLLVGSSALSRARDSRSASSSVGCGAASASATSRDSLSISRRQTDMQADTPDRVSSLAVREQQQEEAVETSEELHRQRQPPLLHRAL